MRKRMERVARNRRRTVCPFFKGYDFSGEFVPQEKKSLQFNKIGMIKILLYVIIYPVARELFAFRKLRGETS